MPGCDGVFFCSAGEVCVGTLPTLAHGVSGKLCIIDQYTMVIRNFNYDGRGPGQTD